MLTCTFRSFYWEETTNQKALTGTRSAGIVFALRRDMWKLILCYVIIILKIKYVDSNAECSSSAAVVCSGAGTHTRHNVSLVCVTK